MSEVKIFKLYEAIKHLEFAAGEIVRSGVDEKFEREVVNSIDNVIELLDICIEQEEENA